MLARLWWKDARQFGPAWGAIALMAIVGFLLAGRYLSNAAEIDVSLWAFAILFSGLYTLAVATAALAGERENGTLRLLDTLPAPRAKVWDGKASFAVVSSLALTLVLLAVAATQVGAGAFERLGGLWGMLGGLAVVLVLMLEAIGWGLFWSALLPNVLAAAAMAACSLLLLLPFIAPLLVEGSLPTILMAEWAPARLLIALVTAALSRGIFLASGPPLRSWRPGRAGSARRGPAGLPAEEHIQEQSFPRPSWPRAVASLAWQAMREARSAWPYLALLGLAAPVGVWILSGESARADRYRMGPLFGFAVYLNVVVALLAGVGVFHAEQRGRAFRLLAHHGVRPSLVWPIKVAAWGVALMLIWLPLALLLAVFGGQTMAGMAEGMGAYLALLGGSFAVGLLCGQVFPRGITAALIGVVLLVALAVPVGLLIGMQLLAPWWAIALPAALLGASWAWTGAWMLDRPGPSRWIRLALLLLLFVGPLFPPYAALRAWSFPDRGPVPADLRARVVASLGAEGDDAGPLYREATNLMMEVRLNSGGMGAAMGDPTPAEALEADPLDDPRAWLDAHAEALDVVRRASTRPYVRFGALERQTAFGWEALEFVTVMPLADLLWSAVDLRRELGDLDGAWDDLLALFRIARQPFEPRTASLSLVLLSVEEQALSRAMHWAMDERQTPERLRDALESFQTLNTPADPLLMIATEQVVAEQTLDLPRQALRDELERRHAGARLARASPGDSAWSSAITTPWEVERARRVLREVFEGWRQGANQGPFRSVIYEPYRREWAYTALRSSPLAAELNPTHEVFFATSDRAEVDRRALAQILALRIWQLEHDGQWPDRLQDLVPSVLDRLPDDPYRPGQPFGYGRSLADGRHVDAMYWMMGPASGPWSHGIPVVLLYSIGPDGVDQRAQAVLPRNQVGQGDIVYPLPDFGAYDREAADEDEPGPPIDGLAPLPGLPPG